MDAAAKKRLKNISQHLASGYLEQRILACKDGTVVDNLQLLKAAEVVEKADQSVLLQHTLQMTTHGRARLS